MSIKESTMNMAIHAKNSMVLDNESGTIKLDKNWYTSSMPEGCSMESMKIHQKFNTEAFNALNLAVGEIAAAGFKANPTMGSCRLDTVFGADKIGITCEKHVELNDKLRYGILSSTYTVAASRANAEFKDIRQHIESIVEEAFSAINS